MVCAASMESVTIDSAITSDPDALKVVNVDEISSAHCKIALKGFRILEVS